MFHLSQNKKIALCTMAVFAISFSLMMVFLNENHIENKGHGSVLGVVQMLEDKH